MQMILIDSITVIIYTMLFKFDISIHMSYIVKQQSIYVLLCKSTVRS